MNRRDFLRGAIAALGAAALPFKYKLLPEEDWSAADSAGYIECPSKILQMCPYRDYMYVLCEDGLYVLLGHSPFDFQLHKVATT